METLSKLEFSYEIIPFNMKDIFFHNIVVPVIEGKDADTIFLTAHHDVININSENINDNTASIINLLVLMQRLREHKDEIKHNIVIAFPDCEEYGGEGAKRIANLINDGRYGKVKYVLNLELTAHGKNIWIERRRNINKDSISQKLIDFLGFQNTDLAPIPFADSFVFQWMGIDSVTIGTLPNSVHSFDKFDYSVWNVCHKDNDDKYNLEDMENFTDFLFNFVKSEI